MKSLPTPYPSPLTPHSFDGNGDGRIDLLNFLNFFLTRDRKERRRAARVTRALEAMREDALHKQVDKIKKQTIGHVDRCVHDACIACRLPLQDSLCHSPLRKNYRTGELLLSVIYRTVCHRIGGSSISLCCFSDNDSYVCRHKAAVVFVVSIACGELRDQNTLSLHVVRARSHNAYKDISNALSIVRLWGEGVRE